MKHKTLIIAMLLTALTTAPKAQTISSCQPQQVGAITENISKTRIYSRRRTYPDGKTKINPRLRFNNSITPQGMAIHRHRLYQFRNGGYCQVMDLRTMSQVDAFYIPMSEAPAYANAMHLGSVCFSNEYSQEPGYRKEEGGLPFLYVMLGDNTIVDGERYGTVAVVDINHNYNMLWNHVGNDSKKIRTCKLIRYFRLKLGGMRLPNFIAAFDFSNGKGWLFGYDEEISSGATAKQTVDFMAREFRFKTNGNGDITENVVYEGEPFMVEAKCGNLQDCVFHDGKVYLSLGGSASKKNPMDAHVAIYDPASRRIVKKFDMLTQHESEGIDIDGDTIYQTFHIKRSLVRIMKTSSVSK